MYDVILVKGDMTVGVVTKRVTPVVAIKIIASIKEKFGRHLEYTGKKISVRPAL